VTIRDIKQDNQMDHLRRVASAELSMISQRSLEVAARLKVHIDLPGADELVNEMIEAHA
jgi:hypothetical protein